MCKLHGAVWKNIYPQLSLSADTRISSQQMYFKPEQKIVLDIIINTNKCDVIIVYIEVLTICRYRREYEKDVHSSV